MTTEDWRWTRGDEDGGCFRSVPSSKRSGENDGGGSKEEGGHVKRDRS